jgi:bifunctional non-homologous end joining protein LigD
MTRYFEVDVEGRRLRLSNLEKVLYPEAHYTKAQVIDYYTRIAPALVPHLKDRPLTLKRYPEGVHHSFFYEKECPSHRPAWVQTAPVWSNGNGRNVNYCLVNDLPSLVWVANLADIELHTSLSLRVDIERPTAVVFDLDPGPGADIIDCARVALRLRALFEKLELTCLVKTSGSKGLQLYIPLNTPTSYDTTKPFAHRIALQMESKYPREIVSNMKKSLRESRVLIDWSQNDARKTTVCVYSLRAKPHPQVSTPLHWHEVEVLSEHKDKTRVEFSPEDVIARVNKSGDLFSPLLTIRQTIPSVA